MVAAAIGMGQLHWLARFQVADAGDEQYRAAFRHVQARRQPGVGVHGADVLQRAHGHVAALAQVGVERRGHAVGTRQHRGRDHADLVGHHDVVGQAQAFQARHPRAGREAQRELLVGIGQYHFAAQPLGAWGIAALLQLFRKTRQVRQRLLDARRDIVARTAAAHHEALLDQLVDRLARGNARDVELFGQHALGGQRLVGLVAAVAHVLRQLARQLHVEGRVIVQVDLESGTGGVHTAQAYHLRPIQKSYDLPTAIH